MSIQKGESLLFSKFSYNGGLRKLLKKRTYLKKRSIRLFYFVIPYVCLLYVVIRFFGLFSPALNQKLTLFFIKHYYSMYFSFRGVEHYVNADFKDRVENPCLIFTTRHNLFSSLYAHQLFRTPLVIPLNPLFYTEPLLPYVPFRFMGKLLKKISYPDQFISYNMETIKLLLEKKYPVLVYINESYTDEIQKNTLYIGRDIFKLLELDVPTYFLRNAGMHEYSQSTVYTPILISSTLKEKSELYAELDSKPNEQYISTLLCEFFMYRYVNIVD